MNEGSNQQFEILNTSVRSYVPIPDVHVLAFELAATQPIPATEDNL